MVQTRQDEEGNRIMTSKVAKDKLLKELSIDDKKFTAFKLVVESMFDLNNASIHMNDKK